MNILKYQLPMYNSFFFLLLQGNKVAVKNLNVNSRIELTRSVLLELKRVSSSKLCLPYLYFINSTSVVRFAGTVHKNEAIIDNTRSSLRRYLALVE